MMATLIRRCIRGYWASLLVHDRHLDVLVHGERYDEARKISGLGRVLPLPEFTRHGHRRFSWKNADGRSI